MILFIADPHYGARPGHHLHESLKSEIEMEFHESEFSALEQDDLYDKYDFIMLNLISDTCNVPPPSEKAEKSVRSYLEKGGKMLLLHGSSAAFWHWDWWRSMVGFRWVRPKDPDGVEPSTHPVRPFEVKTIKGRHPLTKNLKNVQYPEDEIYINLEQTNPCWTIMETSTDEGTFPQAYACESPWGGEFLSYLPGHAKEAIQTPEHLENIKTMIDYLKA